MHTAAFARQSWATGDGHGAKTATLPRVTGKCTRVDVVISSVTGNPTVGVTITDTTNSGTYITLAALADGTHHVKLADSHKGTPDADFNAVAFCNNALTVSIDPSADAGGAAQTLTVDVVLYLEDQ